MRMKARMTARMTSLGGYRRLAQMRRPRRDSRTRKTKMKRR